MGLGPNNVISLVPHRRQKKTFLSLYERLSVCVCVLQPKYKVFRQYAVHVYFLCRKIIIDKICACFGAIRPIMIRTLVYKISHKPTHIHTHTHYALAQSLPNRTKRQYRHHLLISFAYQCSSDFVLFGLVISAKCSNYLNESMQLCSFVSQREVLVHYKSTRKTKPNRLCSAFYLLFYLSMVLCFLVNVLLFFFFF